MQMARWGVATTTKAIPVERSRLTESVYVNAPETREIEFVFIMKTAVGVKREPREKKSTAPKPFTE